MADIIIGAILVVVIGAAIGYIVKAKKSGVKCIGCSAGGSCSCNSTSNTCCSCSCGGEEDTSSCCCAPAK